MYVYVSYYGCYVYSSTRNLLQPAQGDKVTISLWLGFVSEECDNIPCGQGV